MQIFLFNAGVDQNQLKDLERRVRVRLPDVHLVSRMDEITKALPKNARGDSELACILFPVVLNSSESFDRMVSIATEYRDSLFFIFISDDIPASDYKRLVQTGGADWASTRGAPEEIVDIIARVRAVLRRHAAAASSLLVCGRLTLDPVRKEVTFRDQPVVLSAREFALLEVLMQRPGAVLSRKKLEESIYNWDDDLGSNAVEVHIHRLRKKMDADVIRNVRGVGYRVSED